MHVFHTGQKPVPGCIPHPIFYTPHSAKGGIAQLVERQLCKLEVRGSNPLASSLRSRRKSRAKTVAPKRWRRRTRFNLATFFARATTRQAKGMGKFFYVYILQSEIDPERFYTGLSDDLRKRLGNHNSGRVLHTRKWKPWRLKSYVAFSDRSYAAKFERYLKSASGRAFVKKHL